VTLSRRQTPEPIVTKFDTRDYIAEIYHQKNFGVNPPRGFCPHMRKITQNLRMFTSLFFVSSEPPQPIFAFNTSYDVVLRKEMPFGVRKFNLKN